MRASDWRRHVGQTRPVHANLTVAGGGTLVRVRLIESNTDRPRGMELDIPTSEARELARQLTRYAEAADRALEVAPGDEAR